MNLILSTIIIFLSGCSHSVPLISKPKKQLFSFLDASGKYVLSRETKIEKNNLITRQKISTTKSLKSVEKSIVVSKIGSIQDGNRRLLVLMPSESEFEVWLDGKKFTSRMQIDTKNKIMLVESNGLNPNHQWYGNKSIKFPSSKYFCFFGQMAECLFQIGFLQQLRVLPDFAKNFILVWDSFPFTSDIFSGISSRLFADASIKYAREEKDLLVYELEIEDQLVLYYFSKNYDLAKMIWIAQGITTVLPGEESVQNDE